MATVIINDTTPRVKYTANGSTTRFDFDFVCFQTADLVVYVGDTVAETGFTITHDPTTLKGYVTFATAPAAGTGITLVRRMAYDQKVDFTQVANLKRDPLHNEFSRVFAMIQQINEAIGRSVTVDVYSDATPAELTGMIEDLWAIKDDMTTDAANISAITTTAGSIANVNAVAGNATNINAVAGDQTNIDAVAGDLTNIDAAVANETNINAVVANETNINAVAGDQTNIDAVAGDLTNIDAAVANETNINAVAGNETNINAVAGNETNINAAVANATNINAVAGDQTNIDAVAGDLTNIDAAVANATNINTAATNISDINTAAANIAAIIDAPNQASAAAASAALAEDWASKTDGPVEGSEYSAKWYALNTDASGKADKDLSNLTATGEAVIDARAASVFNAKMVVVSALPVSPDADTFYFIPE